MTSLKSCGIRPPDTSGVGGLEGLNGIDEVDHEGEPVIEGADVQDENMDLDQQAADEEYLFGPDSESDGKMDADEHVEQDNPVVDQDQCEEAPMKMPKDPSEPTLEERERHNKTHWPYRSWCSVCRKAKGREDKHEKISEEEKKLGLPKISVDYAQIEDTVDKKDDEEADERVTHKKRLLVGYDRWTKMTFVHLVKCKGLGDEAIVQKVTRSVDELGYRKVTLKADGEPALVAVQEAVAKRRVHDTLVENPPAHDPQANGEIERAVRDVKGQIRALKIGLEMRLREDVDARWKILEWMVPHASDVLNRFNMGKDGKTPHYRVHHKFFKAPVFEFGEQVWAKPLRETNWTKMNNDPKRKLSLKSNWIEGTWVGFSSKSNEHLIVTPDGGPVLRVRTVRMRPPSERWSLTAIRGVQATPDVPNPKDGNQQRIETERNTKGIDFGAESGKNIQDKSQASDEPKHVRDFKITNAHLEEFGFTPGCPGCDAKRHGTARRGHNAHCRVRIEDAIKERYPEDPALTRRDARHATWAEELAQGMDKHDAADVPRPELEHEAEEQMEPMEVDDDGAGNDDSGEEQTAADQRGVPELKPDDERQGLSVQQDHHEEAPAGKRQRLGAIEHASRRERIEKSLKQVLVNLMRKDTPHIAQLCSPQIMKTMIDELDAKVTKKVMRDVRRTERRNYGKPKTDVAEVYSPHRMTTMAEKLGYVAAFAFDLTTYDEEGRPWDLADEDVQKRALKRWETDKPKLLIASPPCTLFSLLQNISLGKREVDQVSRDLEAAVKHLGFAVFLCLKQAAEGRKFVIEHPVGATSWQMALMNKLLTPANAERVNFDFCTMGMTIEQDGVQTPVKKRTSVITNSVELIKKLKEHQCDGSHAHADTMGGKIKQCQVYPEEFCKIVIESVLGEAQVGSLVLKSQQGSQGTPADVTREINQLIKADEKVHPHEPDAQDGIYEGMEFYDDVTGKELDFRMAREARKLEMKFFREMRVYTKVPRSEAVALGVKIITTKWLDINKGDAKDPNYRSRLVGRELKMDNRLDLFAATPPLEALRLMCSICANNQDSRDPFRIMSIDVRRAYFYAKAKRPVYIEIPAEDWAPGDELMVARLNLSLYGTRDAAQNWAAEYTSFLNSLGFETGSATPCSFRHAAKQIFITVHGDDFTVTGPDKDLKWFQEQMSAKYEVKTAFLGPDCGQEKEIRVLNRTLRWTDTGIEYEADQRHAELIVREMAMETAKPVSTPGLTDSKEEVAERENSPDLDKAAAKSFRGLVARFNYLAMDRPDLQFAAKDVSKRMAVPKEVDWGKLKRIARYLVGAMRVVQRFNWQTMPDIIHTFTDSDWAGDRESRKSTSGGAITWGSHTIKTWSTTQQVIALSSGEAELYAMVKGASQSYGVMAMLHDYGIRAECTVCTDASAAIGISHRQGLGKTRHIEVQYLWIQKDVLEEKLRIVKVGTDANPADLMTKCLKAETVSDHLKALGFFLQGGRAETAPEIMSLATNRDDTWGKDGITRTHNRERYCLFTPMKVAGGPKNGAAIGDVRVTKGVYSNGMDFCHIDRWKTAKDPHRAMLLPWRGTTSFIG